MQYHIKRKMNQGSLLHLFLDAHVG